MKTIFALIFSFAFLPLASAAGPRVDLNQDNDRQDILSPDWTNWRVAEGASATTKIGDLTLTLRATGDNAKLGTAWWKPGFDYPARMASDGVTASGSIELVLSGLAPGKHSLATYHNALTDAKSSQLTVSVKQGKGTSATVTPSIRAKHDADTATAYITFDAAKGEDIVIAITPDASGELILNGFELDRSDPVRRANKPTPFDGDEHAVEDPLLAWRPAKNATAHRIYLGTSPDKLELRGETKEPTFATANLKLNHEQPYYWRVDEIHPDGIVTGETWSLRIRHLAFPEAEGYGRFAIGGRGGKVFEVTNLNDAGPGSLREAVEARGPRTVVFRVGGVIALKSKLVVQHPYLTVAGQTAPGDGICVTNYTFGCSSTHDVIMRHMRIRIGTESGLTQDGCGARGCDHCIFDHCSISWSIDEGFSSREGRNITFQRCMIAEALNIADHKKYEPGKGHSFAGSISGNVGSFHHNLLAHCTGRNWSLAGGLDRTNTRLGGRLDIRNNVVYNWRNRTTDGGVLELNFVNNYYLPGPATETFTLLKPDLGDPDRGMRAYMSGNVIVDKPAFDADNWKAYVGATEGQTKVRSEQPLFESFVKTHSAKEAFESVLADVGATKPKLDVHDRRIIEETRKRTHTYTGSRGKLPGIIDSPQDAGGLPKYATVETPAAKLPDNTSYRADGYTKLEHYLNELAR